MVSKFAQVSGGPEYYYQPPTNESFGAGPHGVVDPYERKFVRVAESSIPESGEGVFALRDFPPVRVTCWYSGYLYNTQEQGTIL